VMRSVIQLTLRSILWRQAQNRGAIFASRITDLP
jgi:hypothetical protein